MSDLELFGSPFDAIRREDERGEHWSARNLMPLMGYGADWRNFAEAIDRAKRTAANTGYDPADLFVHVTEKTGGRPREDFRLTRFAAYLVAMNGDPRKPEVAAAQAYFAVRTREAETGTQVVQLGDPLDELQRQTDMTQRAIAIARQQQHRAEVAETWRKEIEGGEGLTPRSFHKKYFSAVPERKFFEHLYAKDYLIDQRGKGSEREGGTRRDGSQHEHPTAKGKEFFYLHTGGVFGGRRREKARVIPGNAELLLRARLVKDGLPANENTATTLFSIPADSA
jgi:hypothetical protein